MSADQKNTGPSVFDQKDPHPERKVEADPEQEKLKKDLDKALKDTFPASDTPAASQGTTLGTDAEDRKTE